MPRPKTTGRFETRDELVSNVITMARRGQSYPTIARRCSISVATAFKIYRDRK